MTGVLTVCEFIENPPFDEVYPEAESDYDAYAEEFLYEDELTIYNGCPALLKPTLASVPDFGAETDG